MGNCGSTFDREHCGKWLVDPPEADPSIVGDGVLVAFVATALLTFASIILGYFTNSIPEALLNDLDHQVIDKVSRCWIGTIAAKSWAAFLRVSRMCLFIKQPDGENKPNDDQRREALKKFILTLSDQQLVTGIALLIGCFANWCRTSVYELSNVISLAWFSAATHLATLHVLRDYFQRNRVVRNWRMIGMVAIMLLIAAGLLLNGFYPITFIAGLSIPIPCLTYLETVTVLRCNGKIHVVNDNLPSNLKSIDIGIFFDKDSASKSCSRVDIQKLESGNVYFLEGSFSLLTVGYLLHGYICELLQTCTVPGGATLTPSHVLIYLCLKIHLGLVTDVSMEVVNNALIECRGNAKSRDDRQRLKIIKYQIFVTFKRLQTTVNTFIGSFLCFMSGFSFVLSYGLTQIMESRQESWQVKTKNSRMDFGQIVPLVLLILPVLAAAEIFHENDDLETEQLSTENTLPSPSPIADGHQDSNLDHQNRGVGTNEEVLDGQTDSIPLTTVPYTRDTSQRGASRETIDRNHEDRKIHSSRLVWFFVLFHACLWGGTGVLLNLDSRKITIPYFIFLPIVGLTLLVLLMQSFGTLSREMLSTHKILRTAMSNNTMDKYKNNVAMKPGIIQDSKSNDESASQNLQTTEASSPVGEVSQGPNTATETSLPSSNSPNDQETSCSVTGSDRTAPRPMSEEHEAHQDLDDETRTFSAPRRQDTESGLR